MLLEALSLPHQRSLQDHTALFIALAVLGGELVDPAQLAVAVLTADVSHHVSAGQHHAVLHLAVLQVHHLTHTHTHTHGHSETPPRRCARHCRTLSKDSHLVEEEGPSGGSGEACGDQLGAVGQDRVTVSAGEQTCPAHVIQEDSAHGSGHDLAL